MKTMITIHHVMLQADLTAEELILLESVLAKTSRMEYEYGTNSYSKDEGPVSYELTVKYVPPPKAEEDTL